ncbi:hypothetical protein [Leptospira ilyithenensis]|uniref:Glycosyltransferase RgtA/B/C/D-like domain-containing protein n=1 Tax=Leptospira ilyithenensis TaxID=2484901 RepID=A0A4R9LM55_9LEPT|nr:hypothetical protein [Leptospira ilyithenensis]TGN08034.1 hypothetical protein EHS11_13945 [Leptospira ilyithenensis]
MLFSFFLFLNLVLPYLFIRRVGQISVEKVLSVLIFFWFNIILTGYITSLFGLLGNLYAYLSVSALLTAIYIVFVIRKYSPEFQSDSFGKKYRLVIVLCIGSFLCLVIANIFLAYYFLPNNPDSEAYRLVRTFLYVNSGNLLHTANGIDPRVIFYPLSGPLSHVPFVLFQMDVHWLHFFTMGAWAISYLVVYYFARNLDSSIFSAHLAALMGVSSGLMFCIATAGNDEVMAGVPMVLAVAFFLKWIKTNQPFFFISFSLSVLISVTIKEHYVFLMPILGLGFLYSLTKLKIRDYLFHLKSNKIKYSFLSFFLLLAVTIHSILNYISIGKFSSDLSKAIINSQMSIHMGFQNFYLFLVQLTFANLPDFLYLKKMDVRLETYTLIKEKLSFLVSWIDLNPTYFSPYDPFKGLFLIPEAIFRMETTVWLGFVPVFLIYILFQFTELKAWRTRIYPWLILTFFSWIFTFAFLIKFQYTVQTYFTYSFLFAMPAVAKAIDLHHSLPRLKRNIFRTFLIFVIITNIYQCMVIFKDNIRRSLVRAIVTNFDRNADSDPSPDLKMFMKDLKNVNLVYTHWEMPYLKLIGLNTSPRYSTSNYLNLKDGVTNLIFSNANNYYMNLGLKLKSKTTPGIEKKGNLGGGEIEYIFCKSNIPEDKCGGKYVLLFYSFTTASEKYHFNVTFPSVGENPEDGLLYHFAFEKENGSPVVKGTWRSLYESGTEIVFPVTDETVLMNIKVRKKNSDELLYQYKFPVNKPYQFKL